ncbi:MAG: ECF-type sigma factor [Vicinamibacteria bacterium]
MEPESQPSRTLTQLLGAWRAGDDDAARELLTLLYPQLEALARRALRGERGGFTLQTGDLVSEAFLRLQHGTKVDWRDRAHFFALAARMLRRIVIDHCRRRRRHKRGDGAVRLELAEAPEPAARVALDEVSVLALDAALLELEQVDGTAARVVELRFFADLTHDEIAEALGMGRATVFRHWRFARAFLHSRLA